ncbi:MAG: DUF3846 domain-containing protein [Clostridia bacterium]|nr:DUF3846 domain-containing protein [Clostridia bacterium]
MIQVIYVNVDKGTKPKIKHIEDNIDTFYKLINCNSVEMPQRQINGKYFTIICDEEGTLKSNPIVSACSHKGDAMLVGNLIITGLPDIKGNLTGLSDSDILLIMEKFKKTLLYHPLKSELKDGYILFCEY